jgi:ribosomal protein S18 acetylase RimI-like enzyme
MQEKLTFKLIVHDRHSDFDWMNIDCGVTRVGKVRGFIDGKKLIIYSINIFPEFEGCGYGKETIEMFKATFDTIIADRVRYTATGFWEKMGFKSDNNGKYIWKSRQQWPFAPF